MMKNLINQTTFKYQLTNMLFVITLIIIVFSNSVYAKERSNKFLIPNIKSAEIIFSYEDYVLDELNNFRAEDQFCLPQQTVNIINSYDPFFQQYLLNILGEKAASPVLMYTETNFVAESIAGYIADNNGELPLTEVDELINDEISDLTATNVQMFHWTGDTMWPTLEQLQNVFKNMQNCHSVMYPYNLPNISVGVAEGDGEWVSVVILFDISKGGR